MQKDDKQQSTKIITNREPEKAQQPKDGRQPAIRGGASSPVGDGWLCLLEEEQRHTSLIVLALWLALVLQGVFNDSWSSCVLSCFMIGCVGHLTVAIKAFSPSSLLPLESSSNPNRRDRRRRRSRASPPAVKTAHALSTQHSLRGTAGAQRDSSSVQTAGSQSRRGSSDVAVALPEQREARMVLTRVPSAPALNAAEGLKLRFASEIERAVQATLTLAREKDGWKVTQPC